MRILEDTDIRDVKPIVVGRECNAEGIPSHLYRAHQRSEVVRLGDVAGAIQASHNLRGVDDQNLERTLIGYVEVLAVAAQRHAPGESALEVVRRPAGHAQRSIRMAAAVQVDRANDLRARSIPNPDVAFLTAGSIEARTVRGERYAEEGGIHRDYSGRGTGTAEACNEAHRERANAAGHRSQRIPVGTQSR